MADDATDYRAWIGSAETREDLIAAAQVEAIAATLDLPTDALGVGDPLPPLWHWFYFLPRAATSALGSDGHPPKGGFMPPVDLPRRMFAGARVRFPAPLLIGSPATREGEVVNVTEKHGGSGRLAFVTVRYRVVQDGQVCIEEEQDIVYREPGAAVPAPQVLDGWPAVPDGTWTRTVTPDPRLLFRFSALTFNAHRIHYDRPYAMAEEGYPGLVVHGPLTALLLLHLARDNADRPVAGYSFRGKAPLFDLGPFRLIGTQQTGPDGQGQVALEAQGPDGKTAMTATADLAAS
ncbi:MAG: MaoC family dehydratase N-terminal domain-containing protein [Rhodospirillaceae bacterium]|nr:MaoC family dehydratase N-terminal domain-containing protein [Rhodospirillaceae bacterium]